MKESFSRLPEARRVALVNRSIEERRSLVERWQALTPDDSDSWMRRAAIAANMLSGYYAVADIGCGNMQLERLLSKDCRYVPLDIVMRDERTVVVDLNLQPLPRSLDVEAFAVMGVLEYLFDVPSFFRQLYGRALVVSYSAADLKDCNRPAQGWVNAYTCAEIEMLAEGSGWAVAETKRFGAQLIWKFTSR